MDDISMLCLLTEDVTSAGMDPLRNTTQAEESSVSEINAKLSVYFDHSVQGAGGRIND